MIVYLYGSWKVSRKQGFGTKHQSVRLTVKGSTTIIIIKPFNFVQNDSDETESVSFAKSENSQRLLFCLNEGSAGIWVKIIFERHARMPYLRGNRFLRTTFANEHAPHSNVGFFRKTYWPGPFLEPDGKQTIFGLRDRTGLVNRPTVNLVSVRGIVFGTRIRKITQRTSFVPAVRNVYREIIALCARKDCHRLGGGGRFEEKKYAKTSVFYRKQRRRKKG